MSLLTALITASGLAVANAGNASALGGETLVCRVTPGRTMAFSPSCSNSMGARSYQVTFWVQNETAPSTWRSSRHYLEKVMCWPGSVGWRTPLSRSKPRTLGMILTS
jgi:hypothetical protein